MLWQPIIFPEKSWEDISNYPTIYIRCWRIFKPVEMFSLRERFIMAPLVYHCSTAPTNHFTHMGICIWLTSVSSIRWQLLLFIRQKVKLFKACIVSTRGANTKDLSWWICKFASHYCSTAHQITAFSYYRGIQLASSSYHDLKRYSGEKLQLLHSSSVITSSSCRNEKGRQRMYGTWWDY